MVEAVRRRNPNQLTYEKILTFSVIGEMQVSMTTLQIIGSSKLKIS